MPTSLGHWARCPHLECVGGVSVSSVAEGGLWLLKVSTWNLDF